MMPKFTILIVLATSLAIAAPKNRDWQTGTMLDPQSNAYFGNGHPVDTTVSFADGMTESRFSFTTLPASNYVLDHYVIESQTYVYLVEVMRLKSSKPRSWPAGSPVKFAISKNKLWLLDADGRQLQTTIAGRKLKFQQLQATQ